MFKRLLVFTLGFFFAGALLIQAGPTVEFTTIRSVFKNGFLVQMPTQVIASGGIITADACGGLKRVSAAGAVSTDATNAITTPATSNYGCHLDVCNVGANTITVKHSTNTKTSTGADLALAANGCVSFVSTGSAGFWLQTSAMVTNS